MDSYLILLFYTHVIGNLYVTSKLNYTTFFLKAIIRLCYSFIYVMIIYIFQQNWIIRIFFYWEKRKLELQMSLFFNKFRNFFFPFILTFCFPRLAD